MFTATKIACSFNIANEKVFTQLKGHLVVQLANL